jgi:hypothetical protein
LAYQGQQIHIHTHSTNNGLPIKEPLILYTHYLTQSTTPPNKRNNYFHIQLKGRRYLTTQLLNLQVQWALVALTWLAPTWISWEDTTYLYPKELCLGFFMKPSNSLKFWSTQNQWFFDSDFFKGLGFKEPVGITKIKYPPHIGYIYIYIYLSIYLSHQTLACGVGGYLRCTRAKCGEFTKLLQIELDEKQKSLPSTRVSAWLWYVWMIQVNPSPSSNTLLLCSTWP